MEKNYFFMMAYVVIVISLASCVSENNENYDVTKVAVDFSKSEDLMDMVASMHVIRIPDDPQNAPVSYSKVKWKGDSLYILDTFKLC